MQGAALQGLGAQLLRQHIRYEAAVHLVCKGAGTLKARSTLHVSLSPDPGLQCGFQPCTEGAIDFAASMTEMLRGGCHVARRRAVVGCQL